MKEETIRTPITARVLFESANPLCLSENVFIASAGLILLQDALELIFIACLRQLDVDKKRDIDNLGIPAFLKAFANEGILIIKQDKIKALNKQRVIVKHHGQQADIGTVREYHAAATEAADDLLRKIIGQPLDQIMLHQLILSEETKKFIQEAVSAIDDQHWLEALASVRMALFLEIENEYNIYSWKDHSSNEPLGFLGIFSKSGWKAPWHTRNKEWIEKNVNTPFDYIQLDHEKLKLDLMEWGVATQDFWNIWRLTPSVFRGNSKSPWIKEGNIMKHLSATGENARYCLDRMLSIILKKQSHFDSAKYIRDTTQYLKIVMLSDQKVYNKASLYSEVIGSVRIKEIFEADLFTPGLDFDSDDDFTRIRDMRPENQQWYSGYVLTQECEIIDENQNEVITEQPMSAIAK